MRRFFGRNICFEADGAEGSGNEGDASIDEDIEGLFGDDEPEKANTVNPQTSSGADNSNDGDIDAVIAKEEKEKEEAFSKTASSQNKEEEEDSFDADAALSALLSEEPTKEENDLEKTVLDGIKAGTPAHKRISALIQNQRSLEERASKAETETKAFSSYAQKFNEVLTATKAQNEQEVASLRQQLIQIQNAQANPQPQIDPNDPLENMKRQFMEEGKAVWGKQLEEVKSQHSSQLEQMQQQVQAMTAQKQEAEDAAKAQKISDYAKSAVADRISSLFDKPDPHLEGVVNAQVMALAYHNQMPVNEAVEVLRKMYIKTSLAINRGASARFKSNKAKIKANSVSQSKGKTVGRIEPTMDLESAKKAGAHSMEDQLEALMGL